MSVRLLHELANVLDSASRPGPGLVAAVRLLVPELADTCVIQVGEGSGELVSSGMVVPTIEDRPLDLPMLHRGERLGTLHLVRAGGRDWNDDDRLLAEVCAARLAVSLAERRSSEAAATAVHYDRFLATLSHELRTPLNVILGWLELVRSGDRLTPEKRTQALEIVDRNARVQLRLIEDILEASRIISGKMRLEVANLPANDLVLGAVEGMRPQADAAKIELVADIGPAFTMRGDGVRLGQVVHNLVGNALRFTPPGGKIVVALHRDGDHVVLTVADDGSGIEPALLPHVFERFRQGERKRSGGSRGLGLGLFIVRHITELHGGTVGVTSAGRNLGAKFTVTLPR